MVYLKLKLQESLNVKFPWLPYWFIKTSTSQKKQNAPIMQKNIILIW